MCRTIRVGLLCVLVATVSSVAGAATAFTQVYTYLTAVNDGSAAWGDYDNDGDLDLLVAGEIAWNHTITTRVYRNDGTQFKDAATLVSVNHCSVAWGDYNSDGLLDVAITGEESGTGHYLTEVYRNTGAGFSACGVSVAGVAYGCVAWGDYDNDGDLDLAICGKTQYGLGYTAIYRNDAGSFALAQTLSGLYRSALAWGDYDNDGDLDLVVAGATEWPNCDCVLYRNEGDGTFTALRQPGLRPVYDAAVAWGDFDNDGDLDLAIGGTQSSGVFDLVISRNDAGNFVIIRENNWDCTSLAWGDYDNDGLLDLASVGHSGDATVLRNTGGGTFGAGPGAPVSGNYYGSVAFGDYDNDGDLDLAVCGCIFRSDGAPANTRPTAPGSLLAVAAGGHVSFTWNAASDAQTPALGLSYNLRVGTSSGDDDVFCGMANLSSGLRRLPALGNAQKRLSWSLKGTSTPSDRYYWSVQAIDGAYAGSPWAPEQTVLLPPITVVYPNGGETWLLGSGQTIKWTWHGPIANVKIELYRNGSWEQLQASVANTGLYWWNVTGADATDCRVRISDAANSAITDTSDARFTITRFYDVGAGLTGVSDCSLAWGDYNNDGHLDLVIAGREWAPVGPVTSKVYRGDGKNLTDIAAGLPGVYYGSLAWGDYDNDGDLDLAIAGDTSAGPYTYITRIYRNTSGVFTDIGAGLTGVTDCSVAWGDYDNDGYLDLALAGYATTSMRIARIYRNNHDGTFTNIGAALTAVDRCCLAWADYDNDGDLDLAIAGASTSGNISRIYRNDAGAFSDIGAGLPGVMDCSLAWGDFDNDGDLDLALAGDTGAGLIARIYRNDSGAFNDAKAGVKGIRLCCLAWGDYDNDGRLDLAVAGLSDSGAVSKLYWNHGGEFIDRNAGLSGVSSCSLAWGDYDSDGDLDLALAGSNGASIYRNMGTAPNGLPAPPGKLDASVAGQNITFTWNAATDPETKPQGLSYNLRVGTKSGYGDVFCGMARKDGLRLIPATGNAQKRTAWTLKGLATGNYCYYWSVQAIDTAFAGSDWATEREFRILIPGDVNGDGCINVADLLTVRNNMGNYGSAIQPPSADINGDAVVNVADLLLVRNRLGQGCT